MKAILGAAAGVLFTLASARVADAQIARHERVKVEPLKEKGKAVGVRIKMTLRPEEYNKARVGINVAGKRYSGKSNDWRQGASDIKDGHLLYQFPEIKLTPKKPQAVTLDVRYADAPKLKPGDKIEIVTAFNGWSSYASHWHVFGMTSSMMNNPESYTLPKADPVPKKTPAKKPAARAKPKPAKKPAKKPTARTIKKNSSGTTARNRRSQSTRRSATPKKPKPKTTGRATRARR